MDWPYSQSDPILIHRVFRLAKWLEVGEQDIRLVDDFWHDFVCKGVRYRVLAEDELIDELLKVHRRLKGFMPDFLVQYMHLPAARELMLAALKAEKSEAAYDVHGLILSRQEKDMDSKIRQGLVEAASAMCEPDDEERPGRFFIYALSRRG